MNRYPNILIRKQQNGLRYFGSSKYPSISPSINDYYIIIAITHFLLDSFFICNLFIFLCVHIAVNKEIII